MRLTQTQKNILHFVRTHKRPEKVDISKIATGLSTNEARIKQQIDELVRNNILEFVYSTSGKPKSVTITQLGTSTYDDNIVIKESPNEIRKELIELRNAIAEIEKRLEGFENKTPEEKKGLIEQINGYAQNIQNLTGAVDGIKALINSFTS